MKVIVKVYEENKYNTLKEACAEIEYDIEKFEVKQIPDDDILKETDGSCVDEYKEYLILTFKNGETSTFRNSHVDMFRA